MRKGVDSPENSGRQQGKTLVFPDGERALTSDKGGERSRLKLLC